MSVVSFSGNGGIWNGIISKDALGAILVDNRCSKDADWPLGNSLLNNVSEAFVFWADYCNLWVKYEKIVYSLRFINLNIKRF